MTLSGRSQTQKAKYRMISPPCGISKKSASWKQSKMVLRPGGEVWGCGSEGASFQLQDGWVP